MIGLQVTPTSTFKSWRTTPRSPSSTLTRPDDADCTLLQHCIGPVLHCVGVGVGVEVVVFDGDGEHNTRPTTTTRTGALSKDLKGEGIEGY